MLLGLTLDEEMYDRPCIVDDSRNSLKISIFTKEGSSVGRRLRITIVFRHFTQFWTQISLGSLDDWLVGTGDGETKQRSPRKHWRGQFHKSNDEGPSKGNNNQLNQQTLYVISYVGCWCNTFVDCFIHQHQTSNRLLLVQVTTGSAYWTPQVFTYEY